MTFKGVTPWPPVGSIRRVTGGDGVPPLQLTHMISPNFNTVAAIALLGFVIGSSISCRRASNTQAEAELIRATERERLRSLVNADVKLASQFHADDFQLINPLGETYSKEQYLGGVASGEVDYLVWEPEAIEVRFYGEGAVIRYQSQLEIKVGGERVPLRRHWHTDSYEKRDGRWQVVWSQATVIR